MHEATQWPRAVHRVIPVVSEPQPCGRSDREVKPSVRETTLQTIHGYFHDLSQIVRRQRGEHDDVIEAVDELRFESLANLVLNCFHLLLPRHALLNKEGGTKVRGQNQDRVAEVNGSTLTICQSTIIENLQEQIKNLGVSLFHLIEQDHRIGATANGLGQLATLFISDVSGRGADEA